MSIPPARLLQIHHRRRFFENHAPAGASKLHTFRLTWGQGQHRFESFACYSFSRYRSRGKGSRLYTLPFLISSPFVEPGVLSYALPFSYASINAGIKAVRSSTTQTSETLKIAALGSELMATMNPEERMPAICWVAPDMPAAM
jgi:hypothetical protein